MVLWVTRSGTDLREIARPAPLWDTSMNEVHDCFIHCLWPLGLAFNTLTVPTSDMDRIEVKQKATQFTPMELSPKVTTIHQESQRSSRPSQELELD
jgi:hypothetical protein